MNKLIAKHQIIGKLPAAQANPKTNEVNSMNRFALLATEDNEMDQSAAPTNKEPVVPPAHKPPPILISAVDNITAMQETFAELVQCSYSG